jgi:predicted component of type VI protein secretion system
VWDRQSCFTLQIGPLDPKEHEALLPGRPLYRAVVALTRFFVGPSLSFHLHLRQRPELIGQLRISAGEQAAKLGLTSFLIARPDTRSSGATRLAVRPAMGRAA